MDVKPKRLFNIKRYESSLRKSLESTVSDPNHSLNIFVHHPMSYQFKHFQVTSKPTPSKNLSKKSSLSHLVATGSKNSDFKVQNFFKVSKIQRTTFNEKLNKLKQSIIKPRHLLSSCNLRSSKSSIRPKSVSPFISRKPENKSDESNKSANLINIYIMQPSIEITPW